MSITRGNGSHSFTIELPQLNLNSGEIVALIGMSGSGKSSLLEMIGLILKPEHLDKYQIKYGTTDIAIHTLIAQNKQETLAKLRAEKIGFMLQQGGLLPFLKINENILLPCQSLQIATDKEWFQELCTALKVTHLLNKYPSQLSIGERQRVAFIRSIIHKPLLLLADEPTSALDPVNSDALIKLMLRLAEQQDIAILLVSHDWELIKDKAIRTFKAEVSIPNRKTQFLELL